MQFNKTVVVDAPIQSIWELIDDVEAVAGCIPGMSDLVMIDERNFRCMLTQNVGAVTARFELETTIDDFEPPQRVVAASHGKDRKLASDVRSRQAFEFREAQDGGT